MSKEVMNFQIDVKGTNLSCPIGEKIGSQNIAEGKIPVLSCEGGCIRGEIARVAANILPRKMVSAAAATENCSLSRTLPSPPE